MVEHFTKYHNRTIAAQEHEGRATDAHQNKVKQQLIYGITERAARAIDKIAAKAPMSTVPQFQAKLERFKLTAEQRQFFAHAQWYVYSDMKISKRSFEDPYFKNMLHVINY